MEWLDLITGAVGSAAGGGVFGLIGSGIGAIAKYFQTKQQQKFEKEKWAYEKELFALETERDRQEDEHELAIVSQQGAWAGLTESIQSDSAPGETYKWVVAAKVLYRPLLTSGLCVMSYLLFRDLMSLFESASESSLRVIFTPEEAKNIIQYIVYSMVFSTSTAIVWWFGDRAFAPPGMKNR